MKPFALLQPRYQAWYVVACPTKSASLFLLAENIHAAVAERAIWRIASRRDVSRTSLTA